jgi:hypothetical protein
VRGLVSKKAGEDASGDLAAAQARLPGGKRLWRLSQALMPSSDLGSSEAPATKTPCESEAENVLRKVKIGGISASIVDAMEYEMKHPFWRATECDKTGETCACPD